MDEIDFDGAFRALTGTDPFPWQRALYWRFVSGRPDNIPASCSLPTGLGKTRVIVIWLIALANRGPAIPRRLVYVVNRRTVVDQATRDAEDVRDRLADPGAAGVLRDLADRLARLAGGGDPLAISTLRGQRAETADWWRNPARPAVVVGTIDLIGSRLLFQGYRAGYKYRPLYAGFLGQDALLVHDEAHLEPAFQKLIDAVRAEQERCGDLRRLRVLALTATPRGGEEPFELTTEEQTPPDTIPDGDDPLPTAWRRLRAKKTLALTAVSDEKQVVPKVVELALSHKDTERAILVFVRTVEAVGEVRKGLTGKGRVPADNVAVLTGTIRGMERDELTRTTLFRRFLPGTAEGETVYLICTAAGEVGVDISADHLVCDLTPFDSMAQRFGRVNRYGRRSDTRIDVVHEAQPADKKKDDPFDQRRWQTLQLLVRLNGDASPLALGRLPLEDRIAAFTPEPTTLPASDILFDAWALTTVRRPLPGRPPVADWLHGVAGWQPPETSVAWRKEVGLLPADRFTAAELEDILDDYPLKPHELLRDRADRVLKHLDQLAKEHSESPVWVVAEDGTVRPTKLGDLAERDGDDLRNCTVLLPPSVGGLTPDGMLGTGDPSDRLDVADDWYEDRDQTVQRRRRVWDGEPDPSGMRLVRVIDTRPDADEEEAEDGEGLARRYWRWFVRPRSADDDASKTADRAIPWQEHTDDVVRNARRIADALLADHPDLHAALVLAAEFHDLGKRRRVWQRSIGNHDPTKCLAKSGRGMTQRELTTYRHEFGSLLDVLDEEQEYRKKFDGQPAEVRDLVLHLVAVHHGRGRPHFPTDEVLDEDHPEARWHEVATEVPRRYARLQRTYGRWGLAWMESLLRAADAEASANPSGGTDGHR